MGRVWGAAFDVVPESDGAGDDTCAGGEGGGAFGSSPCKAPQEGAAVVDAKIGSGGTAIIRCGGNIPGSAGSIDAAGGTAAPVGIPRSGGGTTSGTAIMDGIGAATIEDDGNEVTSEEGGKVGTPTSIRPSAAEAGEGEMGACPAASLSRSVTHPSTALPPRKGTGGAAGAGREVQATVGSWNPTAVEATRAAGFGGKQRALSQPCRSRRTFSSIFGTIAIPFEVWDVAFLSATAKARSTAHWSSTGFTRAKAHWSPTKKASGLSRARRANSGEQHVLKRLLRTGGDTGGASGITAPGAGVAAGVSVRRARLGLAPLCGEGGWAAP